MIVENFLELIDIVDIKDTNQYINMIDISVEDDESFLLSNGIVSHNSAAGGLKQGRNIEFDGIYALRGKIKNAKRLSDLSSNTEWLDIMSILEIEPGSNKIPSYEKIIIFTDSDYDGYHITSLIISFFNTWFPYIIEAGMLYNFITPLLSCKTSKDNMKYFYSLDEFYEFEKTNNKITNIRYLKGLGSLSIEDWKNVMSNKTYFKIMKDKNSDSLLNIVFGDDSLKKRKWLTDI